MAIRLSLILRFTVFSLFEIFRYYSKGHSFGNLFFATWAGFITSVLITADCFRGSITRRALEAIVSDTSQIEMQGAAGVDDNDI